MSNNNKQVQVSVSKKCPPWVGYVHPSFVVVKVGNQFVTIEVKK